VLLLGCHLKRRYTSRGMKAEQLLPEILNLSEFERERILYEVAASLPNESEYPAVTDEEVASRVAEIDEDPHGSTASHDEFVAHIETKRNERRANR
jgi:hypothetical protein